MGRVNLHEKKKAVSAIRIYIKGRGGVGFMSREQATREFMQLCPHGVGEASKAWEAAAMQEARKLFPRQKFIPSNRLLFDVSPESEYD